MNMIQRMEESLVDMLGEGIYSLQIHNDDCPPTELYIEDHGWHEGKRGYRIEITDPSTENFLSVQAVCEHVERTHKVIGKHTVPSATPEEYDALKLSIATFGVRQPIVVDEFGNVIDGRLRLRVCKVLGIQCPRTTVSKLSTIEKRRLAVDLDVCRKHFGSELRKEVAADILKRSPISSDRDVARKCGLDRKKVAEVRESLESGGSIPHLTHRLGPDGKLYKLPKKIPQILTQTDKDARKAQRVLAQLGTGGAGFARLWHGGTFRFKMEVLLGSRGV